MVLRDATLYKSVDNSNSLDKCLGPMQSSHTLSAILQSKSGLCQESSELCNYPLTNARLTSNVSVLATLDNILLLRPLQPRPTVPHLLPPAVLAPPRGVVRPVASPLFMAPYFRFDPASVHGSLVLHGLPWFRFVQHTGLHLESQEP